MTDLYGLLAGLLLAFLLMIYTFRPARAVAMQPEKPRAEFLRERQEQLQENLRDLSFDFQAGKFSAEEFAALRGQLDGEAAALQAEIDRQPAT
jgi:hypothetical protein